MKQRRPAHTNWRHGKHTTHTLPKLTAMMYERFSASFRKTFMSYCRSFNIDESTFEGLVKPATRTQKENMMEARNTRMWAEFREKG